MKHPLTGYFEQNENQRIADEYDQQLFEQFRGLWRDKTDPSIVVEVTSVWKGCVYHRSVSLHSRPTQIKLFLESMERVPKEDEVQK